MVGLTIDWETADGITLANLQHALEMAEDEVRSHLENGTWMHPEDLTYNQNELIPALKTLVRYYGG